MPEGKHVGKPIQLAEFQRRFILAVYDNKAGTSRAFLSIGRKNGKTALIACLLLAHLVGPEAKLNSQIISGARSREQAGLVYKLAEKMIYLSPKLRKIVRPVPSQKSLLGIPMNVEFKAISAEAGTAHGLSPALAILDEVGQVKGPRDDFVEAIVTAQGAYDDALLLAISTQAPTDGDLFSQWIDDARKSEDPRIVSHVYSAPVECELNDKEGWKAANPALGLFRSETELANYAERAMRSPADENSFRWLYLNQRVAGESPFISPSVWKSCAAPVADLDDGQEVYAGLDLSETQDLTAFVRVWRQDGKMQVKPMFWLPDDGLLAKSKQDRVPYDIWKQQGELETTPGKSIEYDWIAERLFEMHQRNPLRKIAFDRWNFKHLKPCLFRVGFDESELEGDGAIFVPFGQGFQSMSPALRTLETMVLNGEIAHGGHPVLSMCIENARVRPDPAGNRKLDKMKSHGRIDGAVALAMAVAVAAEDIGRDSGPSVYETRGVLLL